ncbi:MAG: glycoside hydrolase family 2 TIM barrel-domain containing protein [Bacilli bacterium]
MIKKLFNEGWAYRRVGEEKYMAVTLPHDAMIHEKRSIDAKGAHNISYFEGFDYEYVKEFTLDEDLKDKKIVLEFEGVYREPVIYVNGVEAGRREYGYTDFYLDITSLIKKDGVNQIKVLAHNKEEPNSRWYSGSGIYRDVYIYGFEQKSIDIDGVRLTTISYQPAIIKTEIKTNDKGLISIDVLDNEEKVVYSSNMETDGNSSVTVELENARLWSESNPYLYTFKIRFYDDVRLIPFGIRKIEYGQEGLLINGKRTIIKGACIHHDNGLLGACAYPFAEERKIRILKEAGYNAIRSAHNPCSKALLDACDRLGMLVLDEYVDCWYIHKTKYDYSTYVMKNYRSDLKEMVDKDYNHPSVIMYSTGNEVSETSQSKGIAFTKTLTEELHRLDGTRPVTCGINIFFNFLSSIGFGIYSDKKADKDSEKKAKEKKKSVGSEFFNKLTTIAGAGFMKMGASLHGSDVKTRDAFANMDIAGYNYGIKRYKHDIRHYPNRLILGSETFCDDAYDFYEMAKKNKRIIGDFVWAGFDYLGEVGIGSWTDESYCDNDFSHLVGWVTAGSGRIDITGKELSEMAYTRVAFEKQKIAIGVIPPRHYKMKCSASAWKMSRAENSWNYPEDEGLKTQVEVYSRAKKVSLFVNSKKVGTKKFKKNCLFTFDTRYHNGEVLAIGYDEDNKEIARTSLTTGEGKTRLVATPENTKIRENGLAYIRIRLADGESKTRPEERAIIEATKIENGELLGFGSGCSYYKMNYADNNKSDTYFGECLMIVKPSSKGTINIDLSSSFGKTSCTVEVE